MPSLRELYGIILSWAVISFCFSIHSLFHYPPLFYITFLISASTAGLGFLLHEIAHRTTAKRNGCYAYYQVWPWGLILALLISILTMGSLIFAALGAVYISPMAFSNRLDMDTLKRIYGKISLSGPSMNLLLVAIFFFMINVGGWIAEVSYIGLRINLWLAAFNMLPISPFDGSKVYAWSKIVWAIFALPAWFLVLFLI